MGGNDPAEAGLAPILAEFVYTDEIKSRVTREGMGTFWVYKSRANPPLRQSFLSLRTMLVRDCTEIKAVFVGDTTVAVRFSARTYSGEIFPRELFPDGALAVMSRHTKVTGRRLAGLGSAAAK